MHIGPRNRCGLLLIFLFALGTFNCQRDEEIPTIRTSSAIATETMVKIVWLTTSAAYTSAEIYVIPVSGAAQLSQTKTVEGPVKQSVEFYGLDGLTSYRYEITLLRGTEIMDTFRGDFRTYYSMLEKNMTTRDNHLLSCKLYFLYSWEQKAPAIVMMHDFGRGMDQYDEPSFIESWVERGYACLLLSFRGHTLEDPFPVDSFKGPHSAFYIGSDVEAAIKTIKYDGRFDPENIGLLGGCLGGNGAVIGNYFPEVKTSVVLGTMTGEDQMNIQDFFPELQPYQKQSVFYISGELDTTETYNMPEILEELYQTTQDPKKIWIIPNSTLHGSSMARNSSVINSIMLWFSQELPSTVSR